MSFHWASATRPRLSLPDLHSSITAPLSLSRSAVEHLFVQSSICLFTLCFVFTHLFDHFLVCSFIHSFKHLRIHSCTSCFVQFITHSLAHSLAHQPVHAGWIAILQHILLTVTVTAKTANQSNSRLFVTFYSQYFRLTGHAFLVPMNAITNRVRNTPE